MRSRRLPPWVRTKPATASALAKIGSCASAKGLATICVEARCPNRGECFQAGTATFLILGDTCTRNCSFCAVRSGRPAALQPDEPKRVAESVAALRLHHVVVTSVTRDDLPDGGASVFARTIEEIRGACPDTTVEVLIPDLRGSKESLGGVIRAHPDVLGHNLETVRRLYPVLRPAASYAWSVELLRVVRDTDAGMVTKSGIMVGVGETREEVIELMRHLAEAGCMVLTIGQYLRPTGAHYPVARFISPTEFEELERLGAEAGIRVVVAGPLVRSSYRASQIYQDLMTAQ